MVWVMGGKGPGPTGTGRGLRERRAHFSPPKKPLNPHHKVRPAPHDNSPCGITLPELLMTGWC